MTAGGARKGTALDRLRTVAALGLPSVARVGLYRLLLRSGLHPVQRLPRPPPPVGPFFRAPAHPRALPAPAAWRGAGLYFGWHRPPLGEGPPDWHANPFGGRAAHPTADWWRIPDFDPSAGDVKCIWEASRLDWALALAQRAAAGEADELARLNAWLEDWCRRNPAYQGPNWKCAQEASIRVLHLALAALWLESIPAPLPALAAMLGMHLRRIAPTVTYARGQDNNHGTSEAAALLVGGAWLEAAGEPRGAAWRRQGSRLLEERVGRLVKADGSFSQYSAVYHRLMLDTLSLCELFRRRLGLAPFPAPLRERAAAASRWLRALVDPETGDVPNYGASDGANLLPLTDAGYRDFRPSAALASALFEERAAFADAPPVAAHLAWLEVPAPGRPVEPPGPASLFPEGGQLVLRSGAARAFLAFPRYRFRPSHCDALHLDLWLGGLNLLRDGGTYSYAVEPALQAELSGARGHNTAELDGREQMPLLSRFLRGPWLRDAVLGQVGPQGGTVVAAASYGDRSGGSHERRVALRPSGLTVEDRLAGFHTRAVLRWRLSPGDWRLAGGAVSDGVHRLTVQAGVPLVRLELVPGWESRYYLQKSPVPVLEVEIAVAGMVTTEVSWPA